MSTTMKSLDTLKIYERFKKAKTADAQAKELAEILRELTDDQLATKNDIEKTKDELKNDIEKTKGELKNDIEKTKSELQNDIEITKVELKNDIKILDIKLDQTKLELEAKIAQSKVELIKWVAGLLLAQTGVIGALVKLL